MKPALKSLSSMTLFRNILCSGIAVAAWLSSSQATAAVTVEFEDKGSITRSCTSFPSCRSVQTSHNAASQGTGLTTNPISKTNAYYIFDLTGLAGAVSSAKFEFVVADIPSFALGRSVGVFDVSTPLAFFSTTGSETRSNLGDGIVGPIEQVLNDLGSGQQYASFSLLSTGTLTLDLIGLTNLNAAVGGHFVLGLSGLETLGTTLGNGSLVLAGVTPVPEPEILAMLIAGLGVLGMMVRRRKQPAA